MYSLRMHLFHILTSIFSAGTANVIVAARMVPKMRGIVRGTANGGTEVAQGVNSAQGVRETAGRCK